MTDESKLLTQRNRGARAEALLDNDLLTEAFDKTEETLMALWRESAPDDTGGRERIYMGQRMLQNVKNHITQIVSTGRAAEKELIRMKKQSMRK